MRKRILNKDQTNQMILDLQSKILLSGLKFKKIIGIRNSGLNISIPLSKMLDVPHDSIKISFYHSGSYEAFNVKEDLNKFDLKMREFLLVDDLIDSGSTLDYFIKKTKFVQGEEFHVATLHWNPYGRFQMKPDFYVEKKIWEWIVYPWEELNAVTE